MVLHCGYIGLVGSPNVGKSTLLNRILQQKLSITSRKPQTTRHSLLGIHTELDYQMIYVDTPGIHLGGKQRINKIMNKTANRVLYEVDVVVFIVDVTVFKAEDKHVLMMLAQVDSPVILVVNKVDKLKDKEKLYLLVNELKDQYAFQAMFPISAKTGIGVEGLVHHLKTLMPVAPFLFNEDDVTDQSASFLCAERLREKIFRFCGQELPYGTTVEIESFKEEAGILHIHALIIVNKESHKRMIIGHRGQKLKEIATQARLEMETLLDKKIYLHCFCRVKSGWANDARLLKQFGYDA